MTLPRTFSLLFALALGLTTTMAQSGVQSGIAEINSTRLYFEKTGAGPHVVLLHGGYSFNQKDEAMNAIIARAQARDAQGAMDLWLQHPMMASAMARPALAARIREIAKDNLKVWTALPVGERVPEPPAIKRLGEIRAPTLLIVGERDVHDIQAIVKLLAAGVRGARTEIIPGAAHMPNMEDPGRVNKLLGEFLGATR